MFKHGVNLCSYHMQMTQNFDQTWSKHLQATTTHKQSPRLDIFEGQFRRCNYICAVMWISKRAIKRKTTSKNTSGTCVLARSKLCYEQALFETGVIKTNWKWDVCEWQCILPNMANILQTWVEIYKQVIIKRQKKLWNNFKRKTCLYTKLNLNIFKKLI